MEVKKESQASGSAVSQQPQAESNVTSAATPETPAAEGAAACNINSESNSNGSAATAAAANEENGRGVMKHGRMPPPSLKRPREVEDWLLHPPDGSDPIDLRQEADTIYSAFELSLCRDVVFELHRELHTGVLTKERLWAEHNNPPPKSVAGGDVYGRIPPREPSTSITCPSCNRAVGAARYAPHLDKCALGSSRGRASRSARSSPQQEPSKYADSSSPSSKQSSSRLSSSSKPSPKVSSASKPSAKLLPSPRPKPPKLAPSPKPPKAAVSARPSANSRPTSKPPSSSSSASSSSRAPLASRPAPPPPPPAVHPALVDTGREPLHILVKLVDGAPVQTYHRVVLSTPRVEKPQPQQPRSPSTRSLGSDHRPGGPPRDPSHHSASRDVGGSSSSSTRSASGSSSGSNSSGAGGGVVGAASTTSSARSSFSSLPPRGAGVGASSCSTAVAGGVSRNVRQKQYSAGGSRPSPSGGFYDSRLVDSRGGSFSGTGRSSPPVGGGGGGGGGKPNPSKRQTFSSQGNSGQSSRALVGGYASSSNNSGGSSAASSPPSPPPMARVPPPLFVSAPRSPPHTSPGVGAQGQDMDRRCLERVVEPADRQILSWHD